MGSRKQRVVIVGGGYAGVRAAREAARWCPDAEVVLISDSDVHADATCYYEVATAYLQHESATSSERVLAGASLPLPVVLADVRVQIRVGRVERIDRAQRLVFLASGQTVGYEWLILAVGAATATYGVTGAERYALPLKTLSDAVIVRHHVVRQFRRAVEATGAERAALLTFVIVGGGLTGVETAAELAAAAGRHCIALKLSQKAVRIVLVEAGERILTMASSAVALRAERRLKQLGVSVMSRRRVVAVTADGVQLQNGSMLTARTVVWAGGLAPHPLLLSLGMPLARWGLAVRPTLQTLTDPHVYAVGDAAVIERQPLPAIVPVAYTQGALAARNVGRQRRGEPLAAYTPRVWPTLIALGGRWGLLVWSNGWVWSGRGAWLTKQLVSLRYWRMHVGWLVAVPHWWRGFRIRLKNDSGIPRLGSQDGSKP